MLLFVRIRVATLFCGLFYQLSREIVVSHCFSASGHAIKRSQSIRLVGDRDV